MEINKNDAKSKKVNKSNNKLEKTDRQKEKINTTKERMRFHTAHFVNCKTFYLVIKPCTTRFTVCILYFVY